MLTRRAVLSGLGAGLVAGCTPPGTLRMVEEGFRAPTRDPAQYPLTAAQIAALPYPALGVRVGDAPAAIMILSRRDGAEQRWISADRVVFILAHGRLLRTDGLTRDLTETSWAAPDPLADPARLSTQRHFYHYRSISLRHGSDVETDVAVESRFIVEGEHEIQVLDRRYRTRRVREQVRVPAWRWQRDNLFWIDDAGTVRRSLQRFCPEVPPIRLEPLPERSA